MAENREFLERAIVGAGLHDPSVVVGVDPDMLSDKALRQVLSTILRLTGESQPADPVSVADAIVASTGDNPLSLCVDLHQQSTAVPASVDLYCRRLREIDANDRAQHVTRSALDGRITVHEAAERLSQIVTETAPSGRSLKDCLTELVDWLENDQPPGIQTGLADLDKKTGGLHQGDLVVLAGRPASGKTAFGANLMRHAAKQGKAVGMISGEQPGREIAGRLASMSAKVQYEKLRTKDLQQHEWDRLTAAFAALRKQRVQIADKAMPDVLDVCRMARRWHGMGQLDLLVVDYLQLLRGGDGDSFRLQVGDITNRLKMLARDLSIPVLLLAQVKREVESRPMGKDGMGRMPWMGDIAESAIIEQVADQVLTLYRPAVYSGDYDESLAYLNIAKNRHGEPGVIALTWDGPTMLFGNRAAERYSAYDSTESAHALAREARAV